MALSRNSKSFWLLATILSIIIGLGLTILSVKYSPTPATRPIDPFIYNCPNCGAPSLVSNIPRDYGFPLSYAKAYSVQDIFEGLSSNSAKAELVDLNWTYFVLDWLFWSAVTFGIIIMVKLLRSLLSNK